MCFKVGMILKITQDDKKFISNISVDKGHDLTLASNTYQTSLNEDFPEELEIKIGTNRLLYTKKQWKFEDKNYSLRYGTNPSQIGAFYIPQKTSLDWNFLKMGKNGPSATNIEDISQAIEILKYFEPERPSCIIMKHLIPSAFMTGSLDIPLVDIYTEARNLDYLSSFGGVIVFNTSIDLETAKKISESFIEVLAAPKIDEEVVSYFNNIPNKSQVRIVELGEIFRLPKYKGDALGLYDINIKMQVDGSVILEQPFLSQITSVESLFFNAFVYEEEKKYQVKYKPTEEVLQDLVDSYHILQAVRSNAAVIMKDGRALCGSGETKRVDAITRALEKVQDYKNKKYLPNNTEVIKDWSNSVASTDGFPPFEDSIEQLHTIGVKHVLLPPGGKNSYKIIQKANELQMSISFTPKTARCFTHK
jgi:phosphoribosylaminoimidazolecarboxamide formyltransferase/IMP cyclohydrolase